MVEFDYSPDFQDDRLTITHEPGPRMPRAAGQCTVTQNALLLTSAGAVCLYKQSRGVSWWFGVVLLAIAAVIS